MNFSLGGWLPTCNSGARTDTTVAISRILLVRKGRRLGWVRTVRSHIHSLSPLNTECLKVVAQKPFTGIL